MVLNADGAALRALFVRMRCNVLGALRVYEELNWDEARLREVARVHKRFRLVVLQDRILGVRWHPDG
jgi:hypothetical protein